MIDTVGLRFETEEGERAIGGLSGQTETINRQTGEAVLWGRLGNLRARATAQGFSLSGSLARYHLGSNTQTLTRRAIQEAIEELSDRLSLPMEQARVYRLDLAANLIMKKAVVIYLPQLVSAPRLKRSEIADRQTLNFTNRQKTLCLYDKVQELRAKREPLPDIFTGRNVLRYENRLLRRLAAQFKRGEVRASDLSNEVFYIQALDKWKGDYFLIQKIRREQILNMESVKALEKALAFYGLQVIGGQETALDLIRAEREQGRIDKMQYHRLREKIKELSVAHCRAEESDDISELDDKVRQAVANYR